MEPTRSDATVSETATEQGVVRACPVDISSIRSALPVLDRPRFAWVTGTETFLTGGTAVTITADGSDRFSAVQTESRRLFDRLTSEESLPPMAQPRLFGGFSFTDDHDSTGDGVWASYPAGRFVLPAVQLSLAGDNAWLTTAAVGPGAIETATSHLANWRSKLESVTAPEPGTIPGVHSQEYNPNRSVWDSQVEQSVERIRRGPLEKVVLAQSQTVSSREPIAVADVVDRLGEQYPNCYRFLLEPSAGGSFFGATPERLVTVRDQAVETEALAGSIARGTSYAADEELARKLESSEKNTHEHELVVDAICDQLRALPATPQVGERTVRTLANVQHLETPITASLSNDEHVLSLVKALHPTPAVGGLPPGDALRTIRETETFDRGWYAAPIGWFDADGNGTFAVAIRSGIAAGRTATLFAGAGIVSDSDPRQEWEELQLKYRPILDELS